MTVRVVRLALAAAALSAAPLAEALANYDFSFRVLQEVTQRRGQVRADLCRQQRENPAQPPKVDLDRLPLSPPVGTAGPVAVPPCPR